MHRARRTVPMFLLAVVLVSGLRAGDKPVLSRTPLNEEQLSVYRGFLDKFSVLHFKNLSSVTIPFDFKGFPESRPCLNGIELENVSASLRTAHKFGLEITEGRELKLVSPVEQSKVLQQKPTNENAPNESFLVFSEIVFDTKHQLAVLKYLVVCGRHCVHGATLIMEKVDGRWTANPRRPCASFLGD